MLETWVMAVVTAWVMAVVTAWVTAWVMATWLSAPAFLTRMPAPHKVAPGTALYVMMTWAFQLMVGDARRALQTVVHVPHAPPLPVRPLLRAQRRPTAVLSVQLAT
jgi:hypothetical protein